MLLEQAFHELTPGRAVVLVLCLLAACVFEFVNGFHDTANAVATVIYTRSLRPWAAVLWSGTCNFLGVFLGGIAVAVGILSLLPTDLVASGNVSANLCMVMALLLAAILWNVGTWYLGLPASSSHTLIGAILGVGLAHSAMTGHFGAGVNWGKAQEIGISLLVSPLVGFLLAAALLAVLRKALPHSKLHVAPAASAGGDRPPPWPVRAVLVATCSGVSFAHGSNDGQKGVGLIMLILIAVAPAQFALHTGPGSPSTGDLRTAVTELREVVPQGEGIVHGELGAVSTALEGKGALTEIPGGERGSFRGHVLRADSALKSFTKGTGYRGLEQGRKARLDRARKRLRESTDFAPLGVLVAVALSLGIGTTVGWRRIVVTVGEKIGKSHLTYAQGAAAELVAMSTIGIAALSGLPVSTTHVLSSGIAGTMVAQGTGVQTRTVRSIALAWLFTLPASMILSAVLFFLLRTAFG